MRTGGFWTNKRVPRRDMFALFARLVRRDTSSRIWIGRRGSGQGRISGVPASCVFGGWTPPNKTAVSRYINLSQRTPCETISCILRHTQTDRSLFGTVRSCRYSVPFLIFFSCILQSFVVAWCSCMKPLGIRCKRQR
jgi:hypothetical protein